MKKYLLSLVAILFAVPSLSYGASLTPSTWSALSSEFQISLNDNECIITFSSIANYGTDQSADAFCGSNQNDEEFDGYVGNSFTSVVNGNPDYDLTDSLITDGETIYYVVFYNSDNSQLVQDAQNCYSVNDDLASCQASASYSSLGMITYSSSQAGVSVSNLTTTADTAFASAMGFGWSDVVGFTSDNIKTVMGTGFAFILFMLPWIIAISAIAIIVYFIYVAFRTFIFNHY